MADTTFVNQVTPIVADWLNDVNDVVYTDLKGVGGLGNTSDTAKGDALVGVKRNATGSVAKTLHSWIETLPIRAEEFGVTADNTTNDTAAIQAALDVADNTVNGAQGNQVQFPQGTSILHSTINIPNRVSLRGVNKRGSVIKANSSFTGSYMFTADNGTSSMFDNGLHNLTLDCNSVASLGGVLSDAWQEGGGLHNVLITNFRTYGVLFQNGDGGAALCEIAQSEIFGGVVAAPTAGIKVDEISLIGAFLLKVRDTTIAGSSGAALPKGIDIVNDSLHCQNVHFEECTTGIYLDGVGHHVLIGVTGASTVTNLIEIASTFTGTLTLIGCFRNGSTNFIKDNRTSGYGTLSYDIPFLQIGTVSESLLAPATAKAWAVWDGTTVGTNAPTAGFNVTSVTRSATGTYQINFTRGVPTLNVASVADCNLASAKTHCRVTNVSTGRVDVFVYVDGVLTDSSEVKLIVFG